MEKLRDESCLAVAFHGSNNIRLTHDRVNRITESAVQFFQLQSISSHFVSDEEATVLLYVYCVTRWTDGESATINSNLINQYSYFD